jgi:hypothetical protein
MERINNLNKYTKFILCYDINLENVSNFIHRITTLMGLIKHYCQSDQSIYYLQLKNENLKSFNIFRILFKLDQNGNYEYNFRNLDGDKDASCVILKSIRDKINEFYESEDFYE